MKLLFLCAFLGLSLCLAPLGHASVEKNLLKGIEDKQATTARLITNIGLNAFDNFTIASEKEESQFAYSGFMARFKSLEEEHKVLEHKEAIPDELTLEKHSKHYDQLIADLKAYLGGNKHE